MLSQLDAVESRFMEIESRLADPDLAGKPSEFRALSQEHAHLQEIVQQYRYFKKLNQELSDNKQLLSEKDPEIVLMAKEEIKRLEPEIESVRKKLQILLLPRDPNDNKNIIQVIRAFLPSFL